MKRYNIDLESWLNIEADSEDDAMAKAQAFIAEVEELVSNHMNLDEPYFVVVAENGIEEEEV